jgi:hypothetical protein
MLDWIADWFLKIFTAGPAWIFEEGSVKFTIFRAMAGLIVVVLIGFLIAVRRK